MEAIPLHLLPEGAEGLVFDCDGTLIDSMPLHFAAWKDNCDHFGIIITPQILVELAGKSVDELLDILSERSGKTGQVDRGQVRISHTGKGSSRPLVFPWHGQPEAQP